MLTHEELVRLYRDNQSTQVLSVYLDAQATDPAQRSVWRKRLDQELSEAERGLEQLPPEDREGFGGAVGLLRGELKGFDAFLPGKGWVGFATPDRVLYAETVAVPMPDLVRWERGLRVAPYVRGLKQARTVVVVLIDRRRARLFEYRDGVVSELPGVVADTDVGDLTDVGVGKRGATHSGVRGQTGSDAAQRFLDAGSERMIKGLMETLETRLAGDGFLVLGGTPETISAMTQHASSYRTGRLLEQPSLHLDMSAAQVRDAAEAAASTLTRRLQGELVEDVVDQAHARGRGCLGREASEKALLEGRVDTLLLTRRFILGQPDFADHCVGAALDQQADVQELSGEPADTLDREGGGIGARLRFVLKEQQSDVRPYEGRSRSPVGEGR
jgi:hypothetical protein